MRYPGWPEAAAAERHLRDGIPLPDDLFAELCAVADTADLPAPVALVAA